MELQSLLNRAQADQPLRISRSGLVSLARLACAALDQGRKTAIVVGSREELNQLRGLVSLFTPALSAGKGQAAVAPPYWEQPWVFLPPFRHRSLNREGWAARFSVLYALYSGRAKGLILTADNLLPRLPALDFFDTREVNLRLHDELGPDLLLEQLINWGYQRESLVSHPGDLARRGDILDIFPPGHELPLRLEFFGDHLDDLKYFDPQSQRSLAQIAEALLLPVSPLDLDPDSRQGIAEHWQTLFQQGIVGEYSYKSMLRALDQADQRLLPGPAKARTSFLEQWLHRDCLLFLPGAQTLEDLLAEGETYWQEALSTDAEENRLEQPLHLAIRHKEQALAALTNFSRIHFEPLLMGLEAGDLDLQERSYHAFGELFSGQPDLDRPWQQLVAGLKNWLGTRRQVILAFDSERGRNKFLKLAEQDGFLPNLRYDPEGRGLFALVGRYAQGAELVWDNSLVLGENLLQPKSERGRRVNAGAFKGLDSYADLKRGDLLVHRDYGVGRFQGLHRMRMGGVDNDYLLLEYAEEAKLYLPVDRLSVIQRFKGGDNAAPALDRLGGSGWSVGKEKVRKAVEKIAADLVEMYAWRKVAKGFNYSPIGEMYREFEAGFGFEETPDQARAIQEVLDDMEKPEPMDRLVCGDVGFGKTEVALRAAFRAACDGRQVALLCPTTVLAEQHYQTFRSRLAGFPINVGLLSRFVSRQKQKECLDLAARGQIDIMIGTHRLLSEDVKLPNLGLLVLDEEQRFGVRHKEKLKQMRKNVDALTLTATPIPRTLQLSMSGIRELSVIETAPPERKPVATALLNRDKAALKELLERELARQGQVFWVHNRVQGLEKVAAFVRELAPEARIGVAHGQLPEAALEKAMHQFWHGDLDILVCTAIVESGLDFPRANTLIVDQAQMFGLGQLYQLRGRVGRSDRQAYAIFVVRDLDSLSDLAQERLRIILEMDYLGAGFQVAMEDLRLRGAGNILGEAQSGHMARVGLELYLEMLEEAVAKLKGHELLRIETEMNLNLPAYIPETYITDSRERLKYYKALSSAPDSATRQEVEMELRDRFGQLPEELSTFLAVLAFKEKVNQLGAGRADLHPERIRLSWSEGRQLVNPDNLVKLVLGQPDRARLFPPASLEYRLDQSKSMVARLDEARLALTALA